MGDDIAGLLAGSELFAGLDAEALAALAAASASRSFVRNDVVFAEGAPAAELYVIRAGRVAMAKRSTGGRESVVAVLGPGEVFGEMSLFDGEGRSTEARALDPADMVVVPYPAARGALVANPANLWAVAVLLARRLRATDEALADNVFLDVPARTAKRLLELAGDGDFSPALTQEELAAMVGASRERVNKAIGLFVRLGWVEQSGRRYRVVDRERLASCAAE
ncbi:MAG TPA: Crp/Fnr family transcriptional regulator [Acidimicrobiales bacterium]|nr:Crp/Fnr family transcriptional regulator [Acidimicrobiales bacterium]